MASSGHMSRARWAMGMALLAATTAVVGVCMISGVLSHAARRTTLLEVPVTMQRMELLKTMHPLLLTQRLAERPWNIDAEMQGDCKCERPFDKVTRNVLDEIVCHCPRRFVKNPPPFPDDPPPPTEQEYDDGCKCVVDEPSDDVWSGSTTCTCPILEVDDWDFDMNPPNYVPPVPGEEEIVDDRQIGE